MYGERYAAEHQYRYARITCCIQQPYHYGDIIMHSVGPQFSTQPSQGYSPTWIPPFAEVTDIYCDRPYSKTIYCCYRQLRELVPQTNDLYQKSLECETKYNPSCAHSFVIVLVWIKPYLILRVDKIWRVRRATLTKAGSVTGNETGITFPARVRSSP